MAEQDTSMPDTDVDPVDELAAVIDETLRANALRLTTSRGGYVGGGQPHATLNSDSGAVEAVARGLLARRVAEPSRVLSEARVDSGSSGDAAWQEAEEALPEGWRICTLMIGTDDMTWWAEAEGPFLGTAQESGPTPAAALQALARKLREDPR